MRIGIAIRVCGVVWLVMACVVVARAGQDGFPGFPAGSPGLPGQYGYDDGSDNAVVGVTSPEPYSTSQIAWMNGYTVVAGQEILTGVSVTFGSASAGSNGLTNGGPAQVFILSDPNGDGRPSDAQVLRTANTTIANVNTGTFNKVAIAPLTLTPGTRFFAGAIATNVPLNRYPAAIDTGSFDSLGFFHAAAHASDAWVAAGGNGSFGLPSLASAEYFGNPGTLIGPGYAGPFMVRVESVPEPAGAALTLLAFSAATVTRPRRLRPTR